MTDAFNFQKKQCKEPEKRDLVKEVTETLLAGETFPNHFRQNPFREPEREDIETVVAGTLLACETFLDKSKRGNYSVPDLEITATGPRGRAAEIDLDRDHDGKADGHASISYTRSGHLFKIDVDKDNDGVVDFSANTYRLSGPTASLHIASYSERSKQAYVNLYLDGTSRIKTLDFQDGTTSRRLGTVEVQYGLLDSGMQGFKVDVDGDGDFDLNTRESK